MKNCKSLIAAILVLSVFGAVGASAQNVLTNPSSSNAYMVNEGEAIGLTLKQIMLCQSRFLREAAFFLQPPERAVGGQMAILLKRRPA